MAKNIRSRVQSILQLIDPTWVQKHQLLASDAESQDYFGQSVSMDSTGTRIIAGAYLEDTGANSAGAAYIYRLDGGVWIEEQKIQAADAAADNYFGDSVSIDSTGTRVIVGARGEATGGGDAGAVYIFSRSGTTWTQEQKIRGSDTTGDDRFGRSVSINNAGDRVVVGAEGEDTGLGNSGAIYVFSRSGTTWSQEQKIKSSNATSEQGFGYSVAIDGLANRLIATTNNKAAYVFSRSGTTWAEEQRIISDDFAANDYFGISACIDDTGDRVAVGARYQDDVGENNVGAAYVFSRSGTTWTQEQRCKADTPIDGSFFGASLAFDNAGTKLVIGAPIEDTNGNDVGAIYIFSRSGTTWTQEQTMQSDAPHTNNKKNGYSVDIDSVGTRLCAGASGDSTGAAVAGAVYVFEYE